MPLTILYVEDSKFVSDAVREMLELEGWRVETCADGFVAWLLIQSVARYNLLLLDNELPNVSGLELTRRAGRSLIQRHHTSVCRCKWFWPKSRLSEIYCNLAPTALISRAVGVLSARLMLTKHTPTEPPRVRQRERLDCCFRLEQREQIQGDLNEQRGFHLVSRSRPLSGRR
jgi:hypothetical protein